MTEPLTEESWGLRQGEDEDAEALANLVARVFQEQGVTLGPAARLPELSTPESHFAARFGRFWVAEHDDTLLAVAGFRPMTGTSGGELWPFLVSEPLKHAEAATRLVGLIEAEARRRGESYLEHWSDERLTRQHRLLQDLGFARHSNSAPAPEPTVPLVHFRKIL